MPLKHEPLMSVVTPVYNGESYHKDLKKRIIKGTFAKICAQVVSFSISIGSVMVLSRLLDPKDYGLVAMVTVVTGVLGLFKTAGLSAATVQRSTITDEQVSTLFWINLLVGAILGFLMLVAAPVLVAFYHEPRLFWVTVALAAGFIFNGAGVQHSALLQRQMRFTTLSFIETLSQLVSLVIGIAMAIGGFGYWSLVVMSIVSPAFSTAGAWLKTSWIPGRPRRGVEVRSMLRFGGTMTLNGLVVYIAYNLEKVLLGRFWGANVLGLYGRAYQLINIPTDNLNTAIGGVAFSALSRLQNDPIRFKSYFLKGYSLVMSLTLPITAFCALFANDLVLVLLGPKWIEAASLFRLLSPTILIYGMINPMAWMLMSSGLQNRSLKIALVLAPIVVVSYFLGFPYGPKGVAFAYSAAMTLWFIPHIAWCVHETVISLLDLFRVIRLPFISSVTAMLIAFGAQFYFGALLSPLLRLILGGAIMFASYLCMLLFVMKQKDLYLNLFRGLTERS